MKKTIFGFAALVLALAGFSASAQTTCDNSTACSGTNCATSECTVAKKACGQRARKPCIFEGLDLTDAQKQQLKDLDTKFAADRKAVAEKAKADKAKAGDDIRKARQEARRKYLADVKSIIGDKKYVEFLENYYLNTPLPRNAKNMRIDGRKADLRSKAPKDLRGHNRNGKKLDRNAQVKAEQK